MGGSVYCIGDDWFCCVKSVHNMLIYSPIVIIQSSTELEICLIISKINWFIIEWYKDMIYQYHDQQGFSQDFEIRCPQWYCFPFCVMIGCPVPIFSIVNFENLGCPKDKWTGLWLKPWWSMIPALVVATLHINVLIKKLYGQQHPFLGWSPDDGADFPLVFSKSTTLVLRFFLMTADWSRGSNWLRIYSNTWLTFCPVMLDVSKYGTVLRFPLLISVARRMASCIETGRGLLGDNMSSLVPTTTIKHSSSADCNSGRNRALQFKFSTVHIINMSLISF